MFICAGNISLTSKVHSSRKMGYNVNNEWTKVTPECIMVQSTSLVSFRSYRLLYDVI